MEKEESASSSKDPSEPLLVRAGDKPRRWWHVNKALLPLKIVLVSWGAALASLLPYVTVHLRQRGLTVAETTVIYTIQPVFQLMGPAVAGMIADKIGKYKPVLFVSLLCTIASATGVLFIPLAPPPSAECGPLADLLSCGSSAPHLRVYSEECAPSYDGTLKLEAVRCQVNCPSEGAANRTTTVQLCFVGDDDKRVCGDVNSSRPATGAISMHVSPLLDDRPFCRYDIRSVRWKDVAIQRVERGDCTGFGAAADCELFCSVRNATKDPKEGLIVDSSCGQDWTSRLTTVAPALVFVLMYFMFFNISYRLLDVTAMVMANSNGSHLGREKIWEVMSTAVFSPLAGYLVDVISTDKNNIEYYPAFYLFNGLTALTAIFVVVLRIEVAPPSRNIWRKAFRVIRKPHALTFVVAVLCMGAIWGFVIQFLAWFLAELNSDALLIGLSRTVGGVLAVPVLLTAKWWILWLGEVNIIILSFFLYVVRCVGYSYLDNPWWYLLYESLKSVTENLMWVAALTYAASLSPPGLLATIQGFIGGVHFGIGKGVGSTIGGAMEYYGPRATFRGIGIASGVAGCLYALTHYVVLPCFKAERKEAVDTEEEVKENSEAPRARGSSQEDPDSTSPLLADRKPSYSAVSSQSKEETTADEAAVVQKEGDNRLERQDSLLEEGYHPCGSPLAH